jgi:hypothetical protein
LFQFELPLTPLRTIPLLYTHPSQAVTKLRVACMNLLCTLLALEEFRAAMGEPPAGSTPPAAATTTTTTTTASAGATATTTTAPAAGAAAPAPAIPATPSAQEAQLNKLRDDLTNMLFKNLTSPNEDIHQVRVRMR